MIKCPACGSAKHSVTDSRADQSDAGRWRRRACGDCAHRFSTVEVVLDPSETKVRQTTNARGAQFEKRMERLEGELRRLKESYSRYKRDHRDTSFDVERIDRMLEKKETS